VQLSNPFLHTLHPDSYSRRQFLPRIKLRYPSTSIPDLNPHGWHAVLDPDVGARASRMAVNIGETLLNHPEDGRFCFL
jgi:hypothetical protein